MEVVGLILWLIGMVLVAVGGIWLLVVAFQERVLWGLGCLLVPLVALVFVIMHWKEAGKPFLIELAGLVPLVAGAFMMGGEA